MQIRVSRWTQLWSSILYQPQKGLCSDVHLWFGSMLNNGSLPCVSGSPLRVMPTIMTVLLKNLFTVHFQFDLLKLETNNTRDDELKHAWIIARWTAGWWDLSLTTVATSWVEPSFSLTPEHAIWTGPPILPTPTPNPLCLHKTTICNNFSMHSKWWLQLLFSCTYLFA